MKPAYGLVLRPLIVALLMAALTSGCEDDNSIPTSAFSLPIDVAWACEGDGQTQKWEIDETSVNFSSARMCPDITYLDATGIERQRQGLGFGLALNRSPSELIVLQLNPAAAATRIMDTNPFIPGTRGIQVGRDPIRVLRSEDFGAFYVLSAGEREVTRVVVEGLDAQGFPFASVSHIPLPGVPAGGTVLGDTLVVSSADTPTLWLFDLSQTPEAPPMTTLPMAGRIHEIERLGDGEFVVTWFDRPVLTRLGAGGVVVQELGLVAQCRDGLDNDGDGLTDSADMDCRGPDDLYEDALHGVTRPATIPDAAPGYAGADLCGNGIDDDGDGYTDDDDTACADITGNGEGLTACEDGVDNDGDGLTDLADESCYASSGRRERRLGIDGPFHLTVIDSGMDDANTTDGRRFVYVLDERAGEIVVFEQAADGSLESVDVNAANVAIPTLRSVPFGTPDGQVTETSAIDAIRFPAYRAQGRKNLILGAGASLQAVSNTHLRGEIWQRIIASATPGEQPTVPFDTAGYRPEGCDPDVTTACSQPVGDDDTWWAFGPRVDGRIQQVEVIRRGVPVHRLAQRQTSLHLRSGDISAPELSLRGRVLTSRGTPQPGFAFIGTALEEILAEAVTDVSPQRLRRFGVWPAKNFEEMPTEVWSLTYEGKLPDAEARLGRMSSDTTLFDAEASFCEAGAVAGDWLQLELPRASSDPALHHDLPVIDEEGQTCPVKNIKTALVEVQITAVGMTELTIDPTTARLRAQLPVLDAQGITDAGLSARQCQTALEALDDVLGYPENLPAAVFSAAALPERFAYAVRGADWTFVGSASGFLHRQRWDRQGGSCGEDAALGGDPRLTGRHSQANVDVSSYQQCPPPTDQLRHDTIGALTPPEERFENVSFQLDILPGCRADLDGAITESPQQQDTRWQFVTTGPHDPLSVAVQNSQLGVRTPIMDGRRHIFQVDAAAERTSVIEVRANGSRIVSTYD